MQNESAKLLLDATPLAVTLWDKNLNLFDCNEEALKIFKVKDKQEFLKRFHELSPEYQPDGQKSKDKTPVYIEKTFRDGKYSFEWMHLLPDGTFMPTEVTLVRVAYEDAYVVAGYILDLRENKKMLEGIEKRDKLLLAINRFSAILLESTNEENFEESLLQGLQLLGESLETDLVQIWQNEVIDGNLHFTLKYKWMSEIGKKAPDVPIGTPVPYSATDDWEEKFLREFDLTPGMIIEQVYRQPFPNRFLANLSPFLLRNIERPALRALVFNSFQSFLTRNVMQYDFKRYPVYFTGSIAHHYREILEEAVRAAGMQLGGVVRQPMDGLVKYHSENN